MQQAIEVGTRTRIEISLPNDCLNVVQEALRPALKITQSTIIGQCEYLYAHSTLLVLLLPCQSIYHQTLIDVVASLKQQRLVSGYQIVRSNLLRLTLPSPDVYSLLSGILYSGDACFAEKDRHTAYITTQRSILTRFQSAWLIAHDIEWQYI